MGCKQTCVRIFKQISGRVLSFVVCIVVRLRLALLHQGSRTSSIPDGKDETVGKTPHPIRSRDFFDALAHCLLLHADPEVVVHQQRLDPPIDHGRMP